MWVGGEGEEGGRGGRKHEGWGPKGGDLGSRTENVGLQFDFGQFLALINHSMVFASKIQYVDKIRFLRRTKIFSPEERSPTHRTNVGLFVFSPQIKNNDPGKIRLA